MRYKSQILRNLRLAKHLTFPPYIPTYLNTYEPTQFLTTVLWKFVWIQGESNENVEDL